MDIVAEYQRAAGDLEAQARFLGTQIPVYESTELGRKRLEAVVEALERTIALIQEHPPALKAETAAPKATAGDESTAAKEAEEEGAPVERPEDDDDLTGWISFLLQNPDDEDAGSHVDRLARVAEDTSDWDTVATVYLARTQLAEDVSERLAALRELARIYEDEVGDLAKAFTAVAAAVGENPSDESLLAELDRLAEATEMWAEWVAALNEIVPSVEDKPLAAGLWLRLGRVYNERLDRPDYAVSSLWQALERDPKRGDAWDELATIYKQNEQWVDLAGVLMKRLESTEEPSERVFYLLELGDLYESRLGNVNEARLCYEEVLQIDPDHADARASQELILRQLELWEPLVSLLQEKADRAEDHLVKREAWREAGTLLRRELEDAKAAAPLFEKLLEEEPSDLEVLEALYDIYEETDQVTEFLRIAEQRAEQLEDPDLQIRIYRRMAGEMLAEDALRGRAAEVLERIIDLDPENEFTYRDLEQVYIQEEAWDELVATYRRHAGSTKAAEVQAELLRAMAAVLDEKMEDSKAAVEALQEALEAYPEDMEALISLSSLLERVEMWVELTEVLSRRAELTTEEVERVELHRRIGEITLEKMGDADAAEERLTKALELDPENVGAMMGLVSLYRSRKEWLRAATTLVDAEQATGNRMEKARLLFEAAELHREELDDMAKAVNLYAKALLADPEHEEAASVLADHYFETEQYADAEPLYDLLLRKVDDKQRKRKLALHIHLGLTAKRLKKADKAMEHLDKAREMDPTSLEVLQELADLKYHMEKWTDTASLLQAILVAHRDAIPTEELVEVYHRLGSVKMEMGEKDKALNLFEKALELDATYEPSVKAVLLLREEGGDYERIVATKQAMFEKSENPEDRHRLAADIGDLYAEKLEDPDKAISFYQDAAELDPSDRHVLHKMLEIHTGREQWAEAAKIVCRLAEMEESSQIKAKYLYTAALVHRDELKDVETALEKMEACLEADPTFTTAFTAIETALTERKDWTELARALRRQFKRLPETAPAKDRVALLDRLGEIYADKLGEAETALAALEAAEKLEPDNNDRTAKMAHLYLQAGPDKLDKAILQHHALLAQSPYKIQLYKDLTELYIRARKKDETWCMCSALLFLKKASDKEKLFFDRYRPREIVMAKRVLKESHWRDAIRHPSESPRIDAIFSGVMQQAALQNAQPHKKFGLKRSERLKPEEDERAVFQMLVYAARTLDIRPRPEIFARGDQPQPIQVANASEKSALLPTWLVDPAKFDGKTRREIVFEVARQLAHMRPERYLWRALVSQADLFKVLYAALSITVPDAPVPNTPEVKKMKAYLKQSVPPLVFEQLEPVARELLSAGAEEANLASWILSTQRTALRAGLVLTNDFPTVARQVATEPDGVTGIPAKERVADLLAFSVSPAYFELRKYLGFSVD